MSTDAPLRTRQAPATAIYSKSLILIRQLAPQFRTYLPPILVRVDELRTTYPLRVDDLEEVHRNDQVHQNDGSEDSHYSQNC